MKLLCIAIGGASGALLRYWGSGLAFSLLGSRFPWGTLCVNALGCLLIGLLWSLFEVLAVDENVQALLTIGLLGAFTTFSTFSLETLHLLQDRQLLMSLLNLLGSCLLGLAMAFAGVILGRLILTMFH